ncbi:M13 family peptidase [Aeromonas salmonicida]|uniref:M13 family metallopeptidase n=1 Tax=Aeromonas salmonicida TaxID=645 RepID=UPI0010268520|nr:M13-type metalloendopeptidase [Aeromonas salmonicida]VFB11696.1 M13 family peptidase [Aeromonas salmonicida]
MNNKKSILAGLIGLALLAGCSQAPDTADKHSGLALANMDTRVKPGDDFFRYVNGHWLATAKIPDDRPADGAFYMLRDKSLADVRVLVEGLDAKAPADTQAQQIRDLYTSYLDQAGRDAKGTTPLLPLLGEIDQIRDQNGLARAFARSGQLGGGAPFGFWIGADAKAPDSHAVYLYQSGLSLPDRDYYLKTDANSQALRQKYEQHIAGMLTRFGEADAGAKAKRILALETQLAQIQWDNVTLRDREKNYNKGSLGELKRLAPHIDWNSYLGQAGLAGQQSLIIGQPSYLAALDGLMLQTPIGDWQAYLKWQLITDYAPYLDSKTDAQNFAFFGTTLSGTPKQRAPWERALGILDDHLGEAVGKLYVERYFPPQAKARMEQLVENLRTAYGQSIQELDWMSPATKTQALEKLAKFRPKIGYPDKWKDYSAIEIRADDLVGNLQRARAFEYADSLARLGKPVDRDEWHMSPQTVNAYYNPSNNEIVFPAAILQPPFFDMQADDAVNYGAIGGVIGHEMGHGFDDQGAKSDGDGVMRDWWTPADLKEFRFRTSRLVAQYNRFEPINGQFVNGQFTLGENIGDLGGLTIAHKAYLLSLKGEEAPVLDGFTGEQRFFLGWAQVWKGMYRPELMQMLLSSDPHSPPEYRVNGVVPNIPAFYEAFNIKPGDKLYLDPAKRVKIW